MTLHTTQHQTTLAGIRTCTKAHGLILKGLRRLAYYMIHLSLALEKFLQVLVDKQAKKAYKDNRD